MAYHKRKSRVRVVTDLSPAERALLYDEPAPGVEFYLLAASEGAVRALWKRHRNAVLAQWTREKTGTRPTLWWCFNAPEPRRRIGGKGTAMHDCTATAQHLERGVPTSFVSRFLVDYYSADGHFPHEPYDPDDPPTFESEATYLSRLGLLTDAERHLYDAGELDTAPEAITVTD